MRTFCAPQAQIEVDADLVLDQSLRAAGSQFVLLWAAQCGFSHGLHLIRQEHWTAFPFDSN